MKCLKSIMGRKFDEQTTLLSLLPLAAQKESFAVALLLSQLSQLTKGHHTPYGTARCLLAWKGLCASFCLVKKCKF